MDSTFARAKELFLRAVDLSPVERERLLAGVRADDSALEREVRSLLSRDRGPVDLGATSDGLLERLRESDAERSGSGSPGQRIGDFLLLRLLGRGGMGEVWEAEQESVRRRVALKLLRAEVARSPAALARFRREAEAAGRVQHPGVVHVYAAGSQGGTAFIAQELVAGGRSLVDELSELRQAAPAPAVFQRRVAQIFAAAAEALQCAHEAGVLHRDVKPSNILVGENGTPKLTDFGVARLEQPDGGTLTTSLVGTPHYMSPEMLDPTRGEVGPRADVFSLGVALYESLTGRRPFDGASSHQILRAILEEEPEDPRRIAPDVPRDLAAICQKALEKHPHHRYFDARALAADLQRFLSGEPVRARPVSGPERAWRWARQHPAWALSAAVLVVAVATTLVLLSQLALQKGQVFRLSLAEEHRKLVAEANAMWPVRASDRERIEAWLRAAEVLLAEQPRLRELLASEQAGSSGESRDQAWWQRMLRELLDDLRDFADPVRGLVRGKSLEHGIGMAQRLEQATELARLESDPEHRRRWEEARASIRDRGACPRYEGFGLAVQEGLIPLRKDPASGLWEFADVRTGTPPTLDPSTGRWAIGEESAMVFVLIPGGEYTVGCQAEDPSAPYYDPNTVSWELGLFTVRLDPYLMSKYEMTQGQWLRQSGELPSYYGPQPSDRSGAQRLHEYAVDLSHPVENVGLEDVLLVLGRLGMVPPSGVQWEVAARTGSTLDLPPIEWIRAQANIRDQSVPIRIGDQNEPWNDGYCIHAPVGAFQANDWGLHDVFGNVAELTSDPFAYSLADLEPRTGDGSATITRPGSAIARGGTHTWLWRDERFAHRWSLTATNSSSDLGVRPVRPNRF